MASGRTIVIAGGGLTAHRAAEGLRAAGFAGRLVLVAAEPLLPYDRPPLSKSFLRGETPPESVYYRSAAAYAERGIVLRLGDAATRLDAAAKTLTLASGEHLSYDQLLVATGAEPRRVAVPGASLEDIHYLRTLPDAERLRDALKPGRRLVVVGAGFIGAEVAASARQRGLTVALLELETTPLLRALGPEVGAIYAGLHRDHGVEVVTGEGLRAFRGQHGVEEVVTTSGRRLPCDLAVVGVGVRPAVEWLRDAGLALSNGVDVDAHCRTSAPDVFAAGDVACWPYGPEGRRIRVEHWDNASNQGAFVANAMLGDPAPYQPIPYFWSDQYEVNLQYVGYAARWDMVVFRGDVSRRSFTAFYLHEHLLQAALIANRPREVRACRRLIEARRPLEVEALRDLDVDLRRLAEP